MAAVRHLGFVKFKFFNILHQRTKFRNDRSNHCGDIAIFVIFKMAAAAILNFKKIEILTVYIKCYLTVRYHAKFLQNRSNGCRDVAF